MSESVAAVAYADFASPGEGQTAFVDHLVLAATHYRVSHEALKLLICLTALASRSDQVVSLTARTADLDELETHKLIKRVSSDSVILL
jgi:glutamate racemase